MEGTSSWRPAQTDPGMNVEASSNEWRSLLHPESRHRIVNRIMETLKRHLPIPGPEGLDELKKIAERFEERIYTTATSQSDYLRKISMKMPTMEQNAQGSFPSPPAHPASLKKRPRNVEASSNEWRSLFLPESRHRIVNKIMEILKRHLPISGPEGLGELKKIAVQFEERIYTAATSQSDYLQKISMKMLTMEQKAQGSIPSPPASPASIKKRLPVVQFSTLLRRSLSSGREQELVCAVCLCGLQGRHKVRLLGNCSHAFHKGCIDKWVDLGHVTCPLCRSRLLLLPLPLPAGWWTPFLTFLESEICCLT